MPASPFFLYHSPQLLQLLLSPLLLHAANKTKMPYNNTWGVHDLGTWPICDETPYGQEQMPVEETADMCVARWRLQRGVCVFVLHSAAVWGGSVGGGGGGGVRCNAERAGC